MKKTLVSALTTALVVGAASTTFAAANPFSDVPADHWAYDAVAQLAADGVIEGYGDSSFQGQKNITRYEMAQMVAKAMAKAPKATSDKALIDRLAAEFADELNNLGVRVANLERNADKVKWTGEVRITGEDHRIEDQAKSRTTPIKLRLEPTAEVNANWHVKARLDADGALDDDTTSDVSLKRVWAQGDYKNFAVKLGKFAPIDSTDIADLEYSGAEVAFGSQLKVTVGAGRTSKNKNSTKQNGVLNTVNETANYQYAGLDYKTGKLKALVHYNRLNADTFAFADTAEDTAQIWKIGGSYRFDKNVAFSGFYAENTEADYYQKAGVAQLDYKGAQKANVGTWGAWVAYRHLGQNAVINSTYDAIKANEKGWEVGANYALFKNTILTGRYGWGEQLSSGKDVHTLFGRVQFFF